MHANDAPLRRNRDFNLLLFGQVLSDLGGRVSGIAFPLLVLVTTGSPAKAGIVGAAGTLPLLVLTLPAGALVDRLDRKRVMIVADTARCLALASIAVGLAFDVLTFTQIVFVALVEGVGFVFFNVGERSALPSVVPSHQLEAALARNQAREYGAVLGGTPLGGVLFGISRLVPFLFDAISYFVSVVTLLLIRTSFRRDTTGDTPHRLLAEMRRGLAWFWRQAFIRTTSLIAMGSDFVLNALYLVAVVIARERGASPALVGAMFVFLGAGGILGSLAAGWLARRFPIRAIVVATPSVVAALMPLLILVPGRISPGLIYGAMFFLFPAWNAAVGSLRLRLTPDAMQGRIASIAAMFSLGPVTAAFLVSGFLLEGIGSTATVLVLFGVMIVVAAAACLSRTVKDPPAPHGQTGAKTAPEAIKAVDAALAAR
jgi:MFS family permease